MKIIKPSEWTIARAKDGYYCIGTGEKENFTPLRHGNGLVAFPSLHHIQAWLEVLMKLVMVVEEYELAEDDAQKAVEEAERIFWGI